MFFASQAPTELQRVNPTLAHVGKRLSPAFLVDHSFVSSKLQCAALCHATSQCGSINFRPDVHERQGLCELNVIFIFVRDYDDNELISDNNWHWYEFL